MTVPPTAGERTVCLSAVVASELRSRIERFPPGEAATCREGATEDARPAQPADHAGGSAQNSQLCAHLRWRREAQVAAPNGGNRTSSGTQRKLQRVTEGQRLLVPAESGRLQLARAISLVMRRSPTSVLILCWRASQAETFCADGKPSSC